MSKVGFWLKGSTGKLAGTILYKGTNGETVQRVVMSTAGAAYSLMKAIARILLMNFFPSLFTNTLERAL